MNPIFKAFDEGYSEDDILGYLSKAIPQFLPSIKKAKGAGYTVKQILGFLSKNFDTENRKGLSESARHASNQRKDAEMTKHGLKMAATAVAAPLAASAASNALSRALPSNLKNLLTRTNGSASPANITSATQAPSISGFPSESMSPMMPGMQQTSAGQNSLTSASQSPISGLTENIPQMKQNIQSEVKNIDVNELLSKSKSKEKIDEMIKSGNGPKEISGFFQKFHPQVSKELEKEGGKPFESILEDYIGMKSPQKTPQELISSQETNQEPVKIEKKSNVSTPKGVGEVKEIRNGKALVEIDGKNHSFDEADLESSPVPEKDLADLYDELISGIQGETGEDVSRMVQWAGYNPETNTLQFLPHTGKLYTYGNISSEDAKLLTDILSTRKTSGENFIGAWKAGSKSPIGAALSKLIRRLQSERGGKGEEYEATHEPLYSAYEPAVLAKKKKKKKNER